ncbi:MAG: hypothetical protein ACKVZH_09305 [Blastocatellia bacterium]
MKHKFSVLILLVFLIVVYLSQTILAQITFIETPVRQRPQAQGQSGGLTQEKKKSLSKYGPEDAFPGAREQDPNSNNQRRTNSRPTQATQRQSATPSPSPTIAPSPTLNPPPVTLTPSPTSPVGSANQLNQTQIGKPESSMVVPLALLAAAALVLGALIYVLRMLRKKLKQDS